MLKRKDLAKQFELVVQQEIKNHNDSILSTNIAINSLRKSINEISDNINKRCSKIESELNEQKRKQDEFFVKFVYLTDLAQKQINDLFAFSDDITSKLLVSSKCLEGFSKYQNEIKSKIESFTNLHLEKDKKIVSLEHLLFNEIYNLKNKLIKEIQKTEDRIINRPSEAEALKKEIVKRLDIQKIDSLGVTRKLELFQKKLFVIKKNIENLYTQIERLKSKR